MRKDQIYFTDGNWSVRYYPNNIIINMAHTHTNGTTYVIPFGHLVKGGLGCHTCYTRAPLSIITVWTFLSWAARDKEL